MGRENGKNSDHEREGWFGNHLIRIANKKINNGPPRPWKPNFPRKRPAVAALWHAKNIGNPMIRLRKKNPKKISPVFGCDVGVT